MLSCCKFHLKLQHITQILASSQARDNSADNRQQDILGSLFEHGRREQVFITLQLRLLLPCRRWSIALVPVFGP